MVLAVAGEALRRQLGMDCNIFGGEAECKPLPPDSAFVKHCSGHNHEVGAVPNQMQFCVLFSLQTSKAALQQCRTIPNH